MFNHNNAYFESYADFECYDGFRVLYNFLFLVVNSLIHWGNLQEILFSKKQYKTWKA